MYGVRDVQDVQDVFQTENQWRASANVWRRLNHRKDDWWFRPLSRAKGAEASTISGLVKAQLRLHHLPYSMSRSQSGWTRGQAKSK